MKAFVLHGVGDFRLEDAARPALGEQEALVAVRAAGICGSDIPRIYRTGAYSHPLIPGHEFAGTVVETGPGADPGWLGKRAGVFPLIPCRRCAPCQKGLFEMCRNYSYLGSRRDGGFAQYAAVPADNLIELPDNVSFQEAAMLEPMAVAVHAMRQAMRKGAASSDAIAVCGLGAIGLLIVLFLKEAGFEKILAIGNKEFQRKSVLRMGLSNDNYCDARRQDPGKWLLKQTDGTGADVFFECVGKNETLSQAVEFAAPGGKIILVGNPYGDIQMDRQVYWKILRNQLTVAGTWNSSFTHDSNDDWHYALRRLAEKRIAPGTLISHAFPLEDLERGFHIMRDKTEDYGKIMGIIPY